MDSNLKRLADLVLEQRDIFFKQYIYSADVVSIEVSMNINLLNDVLLDPIYGLYCRKYFRDAISICGCPVRIANKIQDSQVLLDFKVYDHTLKQLTFNL